MKDRLKVLAMIILSPIVLPFALLSAILYNQFGSDGKIEDERHNAVIRKIYDALREKQAKKI